MSLASRLNAVQRAINALHHDKLLIEFANGMKIAVTAGDAIELARSARDIVKVTDMSNGGNGMMGDLIESLFV